jgi:L-threonylcarbamoyladenylate synthase
MIVAVDVDDPGSAVRRAVEVLRGGGVVGLPTDTVYGLAALPTVPGAVGRLFELKGRAVDVPVAVLCADVGQALGLAAGERVNEEVRRIAGRLWPGPLTLVLPRRADLGYELGDPPTTIGVRCPDHPFVRGVAAAVGPIATTSANIHRRPTPDTAEGVAALFGDRVRLVLDGGTCAAPPSTVVDTTGPAWRVIREGAVTLAEIEAAAR